MSELRQMQEQLHGILSDVIRCIDEENKNET